MLTALVFAASLVVQGPAVDILFLGNSYTGVNDLPGMVAGLAGGVGIATNVAANVPGGSTLGSPQGGLEHVNNATSAGLLAQGVWEFVVLQEQSVTPAIAFTKSNFMLPAAVALATSARQGSPDAELVLYQTWGRAQGGSYCWGQWCSTNFGSFGAMQDALTGAYDEAAAQVEAAIGAHVRVAPVGEAWRQFLIANPTLELHAPDGSHANAHGTYLAACVFFTTLFDKSPVGNPFIAGLPPENALLLQQLAAELAFQPTCGITFYSDLTASGEPTLAPGAPIWPLAISGSADLGSTLSFDAQAMPAPAAGAWLAVSRAPLNLPFGKHLLLVDPTQLVLPLQFLAQAAPTFSAVIPLTPGLAGLDLYAQAAALSDSWQVSQAAYLRLCP